MMDDRFEISGQDFRQQFVEAIENNHEFIAQKPTGKDVEAFDPHYGFYLRRKTTNIKPTEKRILRAYAVAKLSLQMPRLGLREFYYTLRQKPELVKYFDVPPETLYGNILDHINVLEILTDVDRSAFTVSTNSKGYIFYPFSYNFGDPNRRVAFSEELAMETVKESDLRNCQVVLTIEKEAAASRLISLGFPELINATVITVGGTFNRAVFRFTAKYGKKFPFIFFCDGDVYGAKMQTLITMGSASSRHLNLRAKGANIYLAGLYPSVGAWLGLPNDVEEKRLSQNKEAQKMFKHLKEFGLIDDQDLQTWLNDQTYELEALSPYAFSTKLKDEKGRPMPIGLAVYLTEFMRLQRIPPKPLPKDNVKEEFRGELKYLVRRKLKPIIDVAFLKEAIQRIENELLGLIEDYQEQIRDQEYERFESELDSFVDETPINILKKHLIRQYCRNMRREIYSVTDLSKKVVKEAKAEVTFNEELFEEIRKDIEEAIAELIEKVKPKIEELLENAEVKSNVELEPLKDVNVCDLYDKILAEIGAKPSDAKRIREALARRLKGKL